MMDTETLMRLKELELQKEYWKRIALSYAPNLKRASHAKNDKLPLVLIPLEKVIQMELDAKHKETWDKQ